MPNQENRVKFLLVYHLPERSEAMMEQAAEQIKTGQAVQPRTVPGQGICKGTKEKLLQLCHRNT